jgi:hypothetical protein
MYRCQLCNTVVAPGVRANRVVVETRPAEYPSRPKAHNQRVGRKVKHFDDPGGAGYEIAKEALACRSCAATHSPRITGEDASEYEA